MLRREKGRVERRGTLQHLHPGGRSALIHPRFMEQSPARPCIQGPGRKKPLTPVLSPVWLLNLKKKPLPRINGERKKGNTCGAGPSGKWERGNVREFLTCITCRSPFKPMMVVRLFKIAVTACMLSRGGSTSLCWPAHPWKICAYKSQKRSLPLYQECIQIVKIIPAILPKVKDT